MGLEQGFDFYDSPIHFEAFSPLSGSVFFGGTGRNSYTVRDRRDGALVIGAAERWLEANRNQPVFAFIHLFDVHQPYRFGSYDAQIQYVDRLLGSFKQNLIERGWWDRSLVIVTADHGEGLGDHGETSHGYFIYQSTVWVPLLLHWPAGASVLPERYTQPAGLIDLAPTILDAVHFSVPPSFEGRSLLGSPGPAFVYSETLNTHDSFGWSPLRSLRVGPYKYVEAPKPELYNLQDDPGERRNLYNTTSTKAMEIQAQLRRLLVRYAPKQPGSSGQTSAETQALLRSLGYLSGGPQSAIKGSGPDPKDRLPEFHLYERAQTLIADKRFDEAIALLSRLLARDPHNLLARRDLGSCYVERQNYSKARAAFEQVISSAPDDYVAQYELGIADKNLGFKAEARAHLEAACKLAPQASQCRAEINSLNSKP